MPIVVCITLKAAVASFMKVRQLLPDGLLVETSTERSTQAPMLFLGDIVFTLRFGYTWYLRLRLQLLPPISKWEVPGTKSLPIKPLKSNDAMQVSSHLDLRQKQVTYKEMPFICSHTNSEN